MNYSAKVEEKQLKIHTATTYPSPYHRESKMEYVQFTMTEPVTLKIRSKKEIKSVVVRPLSRGIVPKLENGEILIHLKKPEKLSVEINGGTEDALLILAEKDDYRTFEPEQKDVIVFPAGVHKMDILTIEKDHTTFYLEEGAYVHGKLVLDHCDHVKVCGYGIISMEQYPYESRPVYARCVDAIGCKDVTIRDITIMDSNDWSLRINGCEDVQIDNVKIFGCRGNSDGIDICGSRRVCVKNSFTRVWDDSLVVKALDTGDVEDITFQGCILWNDFARPMEVGVELRADHVRRVRFENIDVLHSPTGYPVMGIHHGDRALVSDICFENIRIEDAPGAQLFDARITPSYWNRDTRMGRIEGITLKNITVLGQPGLPVLMSDSRLQGYSVEHDIRKVSFENIVICQKTIADAKALPLECRDYVQGVEFVPDQKFPVMEPVTTRLEITKGFSVREDGLYEGEITLFLKNPSGTGKRKEIWLQISPKNLGAYDRECKSIWLEAGEEKEISYPVILQAGKYLAAVQSQDPEVRHAWKLLNLSLDLKEQGKKRTLEFVNYWGDRPGSITFSREGDCLILESGLLLKEECKMVLYAALPVPKEPGEVLFSVEETDLGQVPAILDGRHGPEAAPQLRCPLEITLVFKNQPKVKEIRTYEIKGGDKKQVRIPLEELGIAAGKNDLWLEIELDLPELRGYHYPLCLFHSVTPKTAAHMYGNCLL